MLGMALNIHDKNGYGEREVLFLFDDGEGELTEM